MQVEWILLNQAKDALLVLQEQWLAYPDSMTKKLKQLASNVTIEVLQENFQSPFDYENQFLANNTHHALWTREIMMYGDNIPWLFARTTISSQLMQAQGELFSQLGNKPLGSILFNKLNCYRSGFYYTRLKQEQLINFSGLQTFLSALSDFTWARCSIWMCEQKPLLLTEIFLEALWQAIHSKQTYNTSFTSPV